MKNKISIIALFFAFLLLPSVFSESFFDLFKKKEIILVYRVEFTPAVNTDFYANYWVYREDSPPPSAYVNKKVDSLINLNFQVGDSVFHQSTPLNRASFITYSYTLKKEMTIQLQSFELVPAALNLFAVDLPINLEAIIPPEAEYVYLGTFSYEFTDHRLTAKPVQVKDEFTEAQEFIKARFGTEVKLVKAYIPIKEEKPANTDQKETTAAPADSTTVTKIKP